MTQRTKRISLLLLAAALLSFVLLAGSLSNLQLHSGSPFPGGGDSDDPAGSVQALPPVESFSFPILRGILALLFLILVIYVPTRLITMVNAKMVLRLALVVVVLLILVFLLPRIPLDQSVHPPGELSEITTPPAFDYPVAPLGQPPRWLVWLVILVVGLGVILAAGKIAKLWLGPRQIEDELLQGAEEAVNALRAGVDLRDVVTRCYLQMTRSLKEEQDIERDYAMTVREFERSLETLGFPAAPVRQLTRLFEKARYGERQMSGDDEQAAIESLDEIIRFCRNGGGQI